LPVKRFLFWNINRKPLADTVADLADVHGTDVLVLVESITDPATMLGRLNKGSVRGGFHLSLGNSPAITIYTRFSREFIVPLDESDRTSIRLINLPALPQFLLVAAHLPSKLHWSAESQSFECMNLARRIVAQEDIVGHRRTVLIGDLNMNPFEAGVVGAGGLNAVMSRQIAARGIRTVQGQEYPFFYNPMWCHFGDAVIDTAGSYFYESAEHVSYYWHLFDQVLIRPELATRFDGKALKILTTTPSGPLIRPDGRPDNTRFSDHLPIVFELDL
jgi:hypothetical protein